MTAYIADDLAAYLTGGALAQLGAAVVAVGAVVLAVVIAIYGLARSV